MTQAACRLEAQQLSYSSLMYLQCASEAAGCQIHSMPGLPRSSDPLAPHPRRKRRAQVSGYPADTPTAWCFTYKMEAGLPPELSGPPPRRQRRSIVGPAEPRGTVSPLPPCQASWPWPQAPCSAEAAPGHRHTWPLVAVVSRPYQHFVPAGLLWLLHEQIHRSFINNVCWQHVAASIRHADRHRNTQQKL